MRPTAHQQSSPGETHKYIPTPSSFSLAMMSKERTTKIEGQQHFSASARKRQVFKSQKWSLLKLSLPDYSWQDPEQPRNPTGNHQACSQPTSPWELAGRLSACISAHRTEQLGGCSSYTAWLAPLPKLCISHSLPFCWRGINLFWRWPVLAWLHSLRQGFGSAPLHAWAVTNCTTKTRQNLVREISSSGDRGKWLNSCPSRERFVQFKDRIGWQKDLMFQEKDTIDSAQGQRHRCRREKHTGANVRVLGKGCEEVAKKIMSSLLKVNGINSQITNFTAIKPPARNRRQSTLVFLNTVSTSCLTTYARY